MGFITLGYPDGIVGNVHVSWADPKKVRELVVVGSNKRVAFDDLNSLEPVKIFDKGVRSRPMETTTFGEHHSLLRDGDIFSPKVEVSEPLKNQCEQFRECVLRNPTPLTVVPRDLRMFKQWPRSIFL